MTILKEIKSQYIQQMFSMQLKKLINEMKQHWTSTDKFFLHT